MLLFEILGSDIPHTRCVSDLLNRHVNLIRERCNDFLCESQNKPVFKSLSQSTPFIKVKARSRKRTSTFSTVFNETFNNYTPQLRQRAIHAHGIITEHQDNQYYIFPPNGFRFIYNPSVFDSTVYESITCDISDDALITQLLVENYQDNNLPHAIESGSEILFFNTPYCYAVNTQSVGCYEDLLALLYKSQ